MKKNHKIHPDDNRAVLHFDLYEQYNRVESLFMALKVIAADGRREFAEMENFNRAVEAVGVSPQIVHRAFDRYFAETMPGNS